MFHDGCIFWKSITKVKGHTLCHRHYGELPQSIFIFCVLLTCAPYKYQCLLGLGCGRGTELTTGCTDCKIGAYKSDVSVDPCLLCTDFRAGSTTVSTKSTNSSQCGKTKCL